MEVTIVTVLKSGQHLHSHQRIASNSVGDAEALAVEHITYRNRWNPDQVDRCIVVAGDLCWKLNLDLLATNCTEEVDLG